MVEKKDDKKTPPAATGKFKRACSSCEFCYHDLQSAKRQPACTKIQPAKPLDNLAQAPDWCPRGLEPEKDKRGLNLPSRCDKCEHHYTDASKRSFCTVPQPIKEVKPSEVPAWCSKRQAEKKTEPKK
jgi:hypothetical protein